MNNKNNPHTYTKLYNNKYKNIFYENKWWHLYDENTTTSLDAFYSETQIKLIELVENYNFKIFYFNCISKTNLKLKVNNDRIDLFDKKIQKIKLLQSEDLYYFYDNKVCEVFYSFLKKDLNENYYFDFMLVVNNNFNLNDVFNKNFNLISIKGVKEILLKDLTFEFIQDSYEKTIYVYNNCSPADEKASKHYNYSIKNYDRDQFDKDWNDKDEGWDYIDHYNTLNSWYTQNQFNEELSAKDNFKFICNHIFSFDRIHFKERNKFGFMLNYYERYDLNSPFLTNFAEIIGGVSLSLDNNKKNINSISYTYCCLCDNFDSQGIHCMTYEINKDFRKKIDYNSLEIIDKK